MSQVCGSCRYDAGFDVAVCPSCGVRSAPSRSEPEGGSPWEKTVVEPVAPSSGERSRPRFDRTDEFYEPLERNAFADPSGSDRPAPTPDETMVDHSGRDRNDATVILRGGHRGSAGPLAYFVERTGPRAGKVHLLRQETVIGRGSDSDLVLGSDTVSKRHASVRLEDGQFVYWDFASTNYSHLVKPDGTRARMVEPHVLADGDTLDLGDARLTYLKVAEGASS